MSDGFFVDACAVVALLVAQCGQLFACPKELVINWKNCSIGKIPTYIINLVCIGNWHVNAVTPPLWWNMSCWLSSSPSSKFTSLTKKKIKIKKKKYTPPEENFSTVQKKSKVHFDFIQMSTILDLVQTCLDRSSCYSPLPITIIMMLL